MLEHLLGHEIYTKNFHFIVGGGIIIFGLIVANILASIFAGLISKGDLTPEQRIEHKKIIGRIRFPINLLALVIAIYVVHRLGDFPKEWEPYLWHGVKVVVHASLFMSLYHIAGAVVIARIFDGLGLTTNNTIKELVTNSIRLTIAILGAVVVLGNLDINIGPVLGGLTLFGSAVALAAKDSIQSLIGSLTVIMEGKFKEGDWVKMGELQGFVENIGIRTISIRGLDHTVTVLPNDTFAAAAITNLSRVSNWQVNFQVALSYKSTPRQLENIVMRYRDWLINNPDIESDPKKAILVVRVNDLTDRGYNLFLAFFTKTTQWAEHMRVREQCVLQLVKIIEEEGTSLAYPTRSILLENQPAGSTHKKAVSLPASGTMNKVTAPVAKAAPSVTTAAAPTKKPAAKKTK